MSDWNITAKYSPEMAIIRFSGGVNPDSIFKLCDEIDFAQSHYYYDRVIIEIDSGGGEAKSLQYFVSKLDSWHASGLAIETRALTHCCSAGAYMLSFGDIGQRSALPDTMLLYHNARISAGNSALTVNRLDSLRWDISVTDSNLLVKFLRHQFSSRLDRELFRLLEEIVCSLPDNQRSYDIELLQKVCEGKTRKAIQNLEKAAGGDEAEHLKCRRELHIQLTDNLRSVAPKAEESMDLLLERTAALQPEKQRMQRLAWLFRQLEKHRLFFDKDQYIRPEAAIRHNLIDRIEGR